MTEHASDPPLAPDAEQMLRHLDHLFGGVLDGCHEGRIELAYGNAGDGQIVHANTYGTDQFEAIVDQAVEINRTPGRNVYIGQALRKPETPPFGRCSDQDFFALTGPYVDIDDNVVGQARKFCQKRNCLPTGVTITGRKPHLRVHGHWRLEIPERDPNACRQINLALAKALGGDTAVHNPGRIMRLGGSIAWPKKPKRIAELTEFHTFHEGRPRAYALGHLAKIFLLQPANDGHSPKDAPTCLDFEYRGQHDPRSVEAYLRKARAGDEWHNTALFLVAHWIGRGWSDTEILAVAESITCPGYTVQQTRREIAQMIAGGRIKWNRPNSSVILEAAPSTSFVLRPVGLLDPSKRPPRQWIVPHRMMRRHTTVTAAAPGVGKTTHSIEEAISLTSGRDFLGLGIEGPFRVAIINNEETRDELERRIEAVCVHFGVPFEEIASALFLHSGVDAEKFVIAKRGDNNTVIVQPQVEELVRFAEAESIDVVLIDPFVQAHRVDEKDNEQIEQVMIAARDVAARTNSALHLVHHTRKPPAGTAHQAGDLYAVRGAGAIAGDAHFVFTLADMGREEAESFGLSDDDRRKFVRLDDAKGKLAPPTGARWFERVGVSMPYGPGGEEVGVLVPKQFEKPSTAISGHLATRILKEIDERWRDDNPFSVSPQSDRYVVPLIMQHGRLNKKAAKSLLADWTMNGMVKSEVFDARSKAKGLRVLTWPS